MNNLKTWGMTIEDHETGKKVELEFTSYKSFLSRFTNLKLEYDIIQEHTYSSMVVSRKPDLFAKRIEEKDEK